MHSVTIRQVEAARLQAAARYAPKDFPTAFGDPTSDIVCKATGTTDHERLPPMWLDLADRSIINKASRLKQSTQWSFLPFPRE